MEQSVVRKQTARRKFCCV